LSDLNSRPEVFDPHFSWPAVPGAASYEVEVNPSQDFAVGSKVCCTERVIGTSLSPKKVLPNNSYYWRMRAIDLDGQAGVWNSGTPFRKAFDNVTPTIPNLHVRNNVSDRPTDLDPSTPQLDTTHPILRWDPVPGASGYQVQVAPYVGGCQWTEYPAKRRWDTQTAATAWTPLDGRYANGTPGVVPPQNGTSYDAGKDGYYSGMSYCARVMARTDRDHKNNDVTSAWTQIGGAGQPAFRVVAPSSFLTSGPNFTTPSAGYTGPQTGVLSRRMPLFTWRPVSGAGSYFVVIAKDPAFTQVADIAVTNQPAYAPRRGFASMTYSDETTAYYWAVVPATGAGGAGSTSHPIENWPRSFQKRSEPPALLLPADEADVLRQPVFRWTSAEGAREYHIQVATDPSFSDLVEDLVTASTSYTSERTYPADTLLYWRVRANDENRVGLTWSETRTFRRRLPVPQLFADNPKGGETVPVLRWHPVEGATSYDFHIDQTEGGSRDWDLRGTAATFIEFDGIGTFRWQARANFPGDSRREITGPYTAPQNFTRRIATPRNLRTIAKDRHVLLSWKPAVMAKDYRVQISPTDSFTQIVDRITTDNTSWAPKLTQTELIAGGRMFWRVAAADERATGGWAVGKLKTPPGFAITASGFPRKGEKGVVRVYVRDGRGRTVNKAKVVVSGSRTRRRARRTDGTGVATLPVKPRKKGTLKFRVTKKGYRPGKTTLDVY
jgi:hypothetical protein